ncbi:oligosaccharyl transferase subunit OST3/OST6 family [Auriculariales sp. MPI-PUGE-AT-0066]|nr:oligosaccharyl transferase subunit OST3/OST6 family [Auriculariales sp. MPI-PUGE-AT-0066]
MRLLRVAAAALSTLPLAAFAQTAQEKFQALAAQNGGVVALDSKLFREITSKDREWSVTVQLTALGAAFKCAPCKEFDPTFKTAARSWQKTASEHRTSHFFASIDFENGQDVFKQMGLSSAPVVYTYTPVKGPRGSGRVREPVQYDFQNHGFEVPELVEEISKFTPVPVPYSKPLPWAKIITTIVVLLGIGLVAPFAMPVLRSRWSWAAASIYFILIMVGGEMFTRIRGSPYVYPQRTGGVSWIVQGYQNQLGAEVHAVAAAYGLLAFALVALNSLVTRVPSANRQRTGVILWSTVLMVGFSGLLALFRVKNPNYPFRVLF